MDLCFKQRAAVELLTTERCFLLQIYTRLETVFGATCSDVSIVRRCVRSVKKSNPSESSINDQPNSEDQCQRTKFALMT